MSASSPIGDLIRQQARRRRGDLLIAAGAGAAGAASATLMLGLSGWFLAGAAMAGAAGPAAVAAFNYLLPSAGLRALAITRTVGRYGERLFAHRAAFKALAAVRSALFAGVAATPPPRALQLSSGEASARLVQDVDAVETLFVRRPSKWVAAGAALAATAVIGMTSPPAAGVFLAGLGLQVVVLRRLAEAITAGPATAQLRSSAALKEALGAYAPAFAELRCFGVTDRAIEAVMNRDAALSDAVRRRRDAESLLDLTQTALSAATLLAVATLCAGASLPMLALAVLATLAGVEGAGGFIRAAREGAAASDALRRLDLAASGAAASVFDPPSSGGLRIDGVELAPGRRLAIVGPSGSGKTRLLETLIGLRPPSPGRIRIGGVPLEERPLGWARPLFAYAPQDASLLTGTVAANLRLASPRADDAALWEALTDAQLAARVRRMPQQLDTWIGEGGEVLSGGERRRLAVARALLRPAPWLLLDEPTEGLDGTTERALVDAVEARLQRTGQGLILVSHRPFPLTLAAMRLAPEPAAAGPCMDARPAQA